MEPEALLHPRDLGPCRVSPPACVAVEDHSSKASAAVVTGRVVDCPLEFSVVCEVLGGPLLGPLRGRLGHRVVSVVACASGTLPHGRRRDQGLGWRVSVGWDAKPALAVPCGRGQGSRLKMEEAGHPTSQASAPGIW